MQPSPPRTNRRNMPPRWAFTLPELLVTMGIISLLISLMLPSLGAARDNAKRCACLAHLKNIATSSLVYASDDAQDMVIPVHPLQFEQDPPNPSFIGAYEWGGKSGVGQTDWVSGAPGDILNSKYGTKGGFGPATRPLNSVLYRSGFTDHNYPSFNPIGALSDTILALDLFKCPADEGPPRAGHCPSWLQNSEQSSYDHFGTSFAANLFMTAMTSGGYMRSNSPYLRPQARVPTPSRTLLYEENIGRWAWAAREDWCDFLLGIDIGPLKTIQGWHGKDWTYNRAFVDSHAEYQKIYIEGTENSEGYAHHYRSEVVFEDPDDQVYNHCIIVRGPGWQKDTLPAATIATGVYYGGEGRPSYDGCVSE